MKILFMGPQACGKGTQGEMLSAYTGLPLVSVGQVLRDVPETSMYYQQIHDQMNRGELVSENLVAYLLKDLLNSPEYQKGFIFDGWGRRMRDLQYFDPDFDEVFFINISEETAINRISTRRTCSKCGAVFNIVTMPPQVEGICDKCGGELIQRADDKPEAIKKRLDIFKTETTEVIEQFKRKGILVTIDGECSPEEVFGQIKRKLVLKADSE